MFEECISVGTECEGNVQYLRVVERLLHTSTDGVVVVFGFHNSNREVGLIVEEIVDFLCLSPLYRFATNNDPPPSEIHFLPHLLHYIPFFASGANNRRRDEFRTNISLGEFFFVHCQSGG